MNLIDENKLHSVLYVLYVVILLVHGKIVNASRVSIKIYDVATRRVHILIDQFSNFKFFEYKDKN